jgi:hypothetical protein
LHAGSLNAKISRRPTGNNCLKALKKELHAGQHAKYAHRLINKSSTYKLMRIGVKYSTNITISKTYCPLNHLIPILSKYWGEYGESRGSGLE